MSSNVRRPRGEAPVRDADTYYSFYPLQAGRLLYEEPCRRDACLPICITWKKYHANAVARSVAGYRSNCMSTT